MCFEAMGVEGRLLFSSYRANRAFRAFGRVFDLWLGFSVEVPATT